MSKRRIMKILEINPSDFKVCEVRIFKEKTFFGLGENTWRVHFYEMDKYTLEKEK